MDIDGAMHIEEVERHLGVLKDLLSQYVDMHNKLEVAFGNEYAGRFGDAFCTQNASLTDEITLSMEKLQLLRKAKEDMLLMEKLQEERKIYDEKVSLSDHILDEIKMRCTKIDDVCSVDLENLDDDHILERKRNLQLVRTEYNAVVDHVTTLVREAPRAYNTATGIVDAAKKERDAVTVIVDDYVKDLETQVLNRNLADGKARNKSMKIELSKFSGYSSKLDIYTFQAEFEKLIAPEIVRNLQPEYLKKNYLEGQALLLVKEMDNLDEIWEKLKSSFGCTMILLQNKFDHVRKCGDLWKIHDKEKLLSSLTKLINGMMELETLAEKHGIEDQLYHHSYISLIFDMIGHRKLEKFAYKNAGVKMSCREKWAKIREFLSVDVGVLEELVMEEKSRRSHSQKKDNQSKLLKNGAPGDGGSAHHSGGVNNVLCTLCGKDDHVMLEVVRISSIILHARLGY